jgi:hypothetical protein
MARLDADNWTEADDTDNPVNVFSILGFKLPSGGFPSLGKLAGQQLALTQSSGANSAAAGPVGSVTGAAPENSTQAAFFAAILKAIGAPNTAANQKSLSDWYSHENSSWPPAASNNPFNSTLSAPGATTFNSVGVRNYVSALQGVQATVSTLNSYPAIVSALKTGNGFCGASQQTPTLAAAFHLWSGGGYSSVCL